MKRLLALTVAGLLLLAMSGTAGAVQILFKDFEDSSGFTLGGGDNAYWITWGIAPLTGTITAPAAFVQGGSHEGSIFYGSHAREYMNAPAATMTIALPDLTGYENLKLKVSLAAPEAIWENSHRDSLHILGGLTTSPPLIECDIAAGCMPVTDAIDSFLPTAYRHGYLQSQTYSTNLTLTFQDHGYAIDNSLISITFAFASTDYPEYVGIDSVKITGDLIQPVPEPSTMLLLGSGLLGLVGVNRRRKAQRASMGREKRA